MLFILDVSSYQNQSTRQFADEEHNSLVIMATPEEYRAVAAALRELDIVPLQVMVEATIISVSLNDDLKYGVQWFFESGNHQFNFQTAEAIGLAIPGFSYFFGTAIRRKEDGPDESASSPVRG